MVFNSKKDFKEGMVAGAKPFEEKFSNVSQEMRENHDSLKESINDIKENSNYILEKLSEREKKELYDLSIVSDIRELDEDDKQMLVAMLYEIANEYFDSITENQQEYLLRLQKYLEISNSNLQTNMNLLSIINYEDLNINKAFYQLANEFIFLGDNNFHHDELDTLLYDYFNLNKLNKEKIISEILHINKIVGEKGLIEKYGYEIPDEDYKKKEDLDYKDSLLEKLIIFWQDINSTSDDLKVYINRNEDLESRKHIIEIVERMPNYEKYFTLEDVLAANKNFIILKHGYIYKYEYEDNYIPVIVQDIIQYKVESDGNKSIRKILIEKQDRTIVEMDFFLMNGFIHSIYKNEVFAALFLYMQDESLGIEEILEKMKFLIRILIPDNESSFYGSETILDKELFNVKYDGSKLYSECLKKVYINDEGIYIGDKLYAFSEVKKFNYHNTDKFFGKSDVSLYMELNNGKIINLFSDKIRTVYDLEKFEVEHLNETYALIKGLSKLKTLF